MASGRFLNEISILGRAWIRGRLFLRILVASLLIATMGGNPSFADEPARASTVDEVKILVDNASAEYALGHFREALVKFEAAYRLRHLPGLLFNIAQCHRQLKEFDQAAVTLRSFIRLDSESPNVAVATDLLAQVEDALRAQSKAQTAPPTDANGRDVSRSPNLTPPAAKAAAEPVSSLHVATVKPAASEKAPDTAIAAREPDRGAKWRHLGYGLVIGGVVAGGGSGLFAFLGKSQNDKIMSGRYASTPALLDAESAGQRDNTLAVVFGAAAGAAVIGGLVAIFLNGEPAQVAVAASPNSVMLAGTF